MKPSDLNYRHLMYFWAVAKEGTLAKGAEKMGLSSQALSSQISALEKQLGSVLFEHEGRGLVLTDAGRLVLERAESIFMAGAKLRQDLESAKAARSRLAVGASDAIPKGVTFKLLEPALALDGWAVDCREGDFESLLSDLALGRLDLVLADRPPPERPGVRLAGCLLRRDRIAFYAAGPLLASLGLEPGGSLDPEALAGLPAFLPARSDPLRGRLDAWLEERQIALDPVGDLADSALLKAFGASGRGLFPAPSSLREELASGCSAAPLIELDGVEERWHAIWVPRKTLHVAVAAVLSGADKA